MLRDALIDTAMRLRLDGPLRSIRANVSPSYRRDGAGERRLRLLLAAELHADSNCLDIGAYRGRVLAEIVRLAPSGRHIAFEPLPHLYKRLVGRFPSVDIRQAAVSNEVGMKTFSYAKNEPARSGLRDTAYSRRTQIERITVDSQTIDASLPYGYVPTLIKIDVEGAERSVFEGGIQTISTHKPTIIFECGQAGIRHYDTQPREIYEILHDRAGLRIFGLDGSGPYTPREFEESCALDIRWDYVARV
jgi:FkbM family methyltransferase